MWQIANSATHRGVPLWLAERQLAGEGYEVAAPTQLQLLGPEVSDLGPRREARKTPLTLLELSPWARARLPATSRVTGVPRQSEFSILLQAVKLREEVRGAAVLRYSAK